jgi:hypothetical protein
MVDRLDQRQAHHKPQNTGHDDAEGVPGPDRLHLLGSGDDKSFNRNSRWFSEGQWPNLSASSMRTWLPSCTIFDVRFLPAVAQVKDGLQTIEKLMNPSAEKYLPTDMSLSDLFKEYRRVHEKWFNADDEAKINDLIDVRCVQRACRVYWQSASTEFDYWRCQDRDCAQERDDLQEITRADEDGDCGVRGIGRRELPRLRSQDAPNYARQVSLASEVHYSALCRARVIRVYPGGTAYAVGCTPSPGSSSSCRSSARRCTKRTSCNRWRLCFAATRCTSDLQYSCACGCKLGHWWIL